MPEMKRVATTTIYQSTIVLTNEINTDGIGMDATVIKNVIISFQINYFEIIFTSDKELSNLCTLRQLSPTKIFIPIKNSTIKSHHNIYTNQKFNSRNFSFFIIIKIINKILR
jgi:hypothetical protein